MPLSITDYDTFFELPEFYLFFFKIYVLPKIHSHQKSLCSLVILLDMFLAAAKAPLLEREEEATWSVVTETEYR
jgi:hypothetical protein